MTQTDYLGKNLSKAELEARREAREAKQRLENRRFGLLIFQVSWMMAFFALVMVNWQLRFSYESWPPPGVAAMGIALPTLATLILLGAVILARRTRTLPDEASAGRFMVQWQAAIGLTAAFVVMMVVEWFRVQTGTQYSAVFRLMTGFHSLHALAVGGYMGFILYEARQRLATGNTPTDGNPWPVESASKMLDFVFVAWLLFYVVLYWWRS